MSTLSESAYPAHWEADVVLRDGGTARIRPITPDDAQRLVSFYEQVSDESKYYRFFAPYPRLSDRDVHRFTHHDYVDRVGLAATVGGEFIATVRYDRIDERGLPAKEPGADQAEVAFLVQDAHQGRGVASALLEHIAAVAQERGIRRFAAEVLPANSKMIKVFTDAGYTHKRTFEDGVVRLEFGLEPTERSMAVMRGREQRAEARSVQRLLAPGSVAVVGTGRTPGGVGRSALRSLLGSGFTGRTYAVNHAFPESGGRLEPEGVPAYRRVRDIPEPVDLALLAVPAAQVPEVVRDCGEHGVQGLVILSSGYAESGPPGRERQRDLLRQVRSYGMRLIGPNAFGLINTAPAVRLNASLAPQMPGAGRIGLFTQSGAIGIALLSGLHQRGPGDGGICGISTFVSAGNRADVSGNDLLQYWYEDPDTDVALLYLESIGNPRKFTRLARRTAAVKPVVVAKGARHNGTAPPGHTVPTTRIPDSTVSALLRQAGVLRVDTVTELIDAGLLLASQPLPTGPRVAILGNSEALALLTYDACLTEGLRPLRPHVLASSATPGDFRTALKEALADDRCDAVVVTAIPWVGEGGSAVPGEGAALATALREAAGGGAAKPVAVVHLAMDALAEALGTGLPPGTDPGPDTGTELRPPTEEGGSTAPVRPPTVPADSATSVAPATSAIPIAPRIPAYPAAERAVRSLAEAVRYAQWRQDAAEPGRVPEYDDIQEAAAGADIERLLNDLTRDADPARPVPLPPDATRALLARYGIHVRPALPAPDPDAAVRAAAGLGYPVALKTTAPHLRHRPDLGGVRLDLPGEAELRRAYAELTDSLGTPEELRPVVQSMVPRGVDTLVRAAIDPAAGAVLTFGLAGAPSQLLGDTAHRLIPATDRDVAGQIRSIRTAPLLFGWRGSQPVDTAALEELLLRVSRLVDDHPEVVGVDLEPVVVAPHGVSVLEAVVRLARPPATTDLGPRRLPAY
ncbi:bifunctional GNAT family N-acetyltransferase/acetate--CoA ligase family protein [Streptomyces sp. MST-110588]|uniref:bifunctional acetate--CoA ligase family protein/GNAT family N-acetyltransferase n=1 Tax=Streptomyces sp. MST-110588 TaxID=2833628 RepID=UPI001F5D2979|nr:bifunctional GNAT family N-acetyltransferase/acetate--CoA ligase family protein [Streptomyces sp. MST-110588]UNO39551.1 GNAT family N-acetyltransferase [Streptomyces sp. MST-110588]